MKSNELIVKQGTKLKI